MLTSISSVEHRWSAGSCVEVGRRRVEDDVVGVTTLVDDHVLVLRRTPADGVRVYVMITPETPSTLMGSAVLRLVAPLWLTLSRYWAS